MSAHGGPGVVRPATADDVDAVTLLWNDPFFWGDEGDDERAGYVHRLVVSRAHAGLGARDVEGEWVTTNGHRQTWCTSLYRRSAR